MPRPSFKTIACLCLSIAAITVSCVATLLSAASTEAWIVMTIMFAFMHRISCMGRGDQEQDWPGKTPPDSDSEAALMAKKAKDSQAQPLLKGPLVKQKAPPGRKGISRALWATLGIDTGSEDPVSAIVNTPKEVAKIQAWLECMEWCPHQANKEESMVFFVAVRVFAQRKAASCVERTMLCMVSCGVPATLAMYTELIHMLGRRGDMRGARSWLVRMKRVGLKADSQLYSCLIHVCARGGHVDSATEWYYEMLRDGLIPTEVTLNSMINACAKSGSGPDLAEVWFSELQAWGLEPSRYTYNSLIHACCQVGLTERAEAWLMAMIRSGVGPDTVSYATIVHAINKSPMIRIMQVDRLMRHMMNTIDPDRRQLSMMYRATIQVCARGRELDLALFWADYAEEERVSIGRYSYKFIAIGLRRGGRQKDAIALEKRIAEFDEEKRIRLAITEKQPRVSDTNVLDACGSDDMSTTGEGTIRGSESDLGEFEHMLEDLKIRR